jgi:hypothetical protein
VGRSSSIAAAAAIAIGVGALAVSCSAVDGGAGSAGTAATAGGGRGTFDGFCEASSVVPWRGGFLVADNETDDRLYAFSAAMAPLPPLVLAPPLEDIEALALTPAGLLAVASQSRTKHGKRRPAREQVLLEGHAPITPDLSGCGPCAAARRLPPKEGGLSVEGAATWGGALWLGLRSPLGAGGKAILLRMAGEPSSSLSVAEVVEVDLGGLGVRDLMPSGSELLLLAGPADDASVPHRLYRLASPGATPVRLASTLENGTEGLAPAPGGGLLVVTDGSGAPGRRCREAATWRVIPDPTPP